MSYFCRKICLVFCVVVCLLPKILLGQEGRERPRTDQPDPNLASEIVQLCRAAPEVSEQTLFAQFSNAHLDMDKDYLWRQIHIVLFETARSRGRSVADCARMVREAGFTLRKGPSPALQGPLRKAAVA